MSMTFAIQQTQHLHGLMLNCLYLPEPECVQFACCAFWDDTWRLSYLTNYISVTQYMNGKEHLFLHLLQYLFQSMYCYITNLVISSLIVIPISV